ncbi:MAG TPA: hypothetical protein VH000_01765 [Rhizomicrobium sp.]|nr:hypothetical protein [Rhizomicrobium sp.]
MPPKIGQNVRAVKLHFGVRWVERQNPFKGLERFLKPAQLFQGVPAIVISRRKIWLRGNRRVIFGHCPSEPANAQEAVAALEMRFRGHWNFRFRIAVFAGRGHKIISSPNVKFALDEWWAL